MFWKGYLKLSLVICPVTLSSATSKSETVRFHTLNARTGIGRNAGSRRLFPTGTMRPNGWVC